MSNGEVGREVTRGGEGRTDAVAERLGPLPAQPRHGLDSETTDEPMAPTLQRAGTEVNGYTVLETAFANECSVQFTRPPTLPAPAPSPDGPLSAKPSPL